MTTKHKFRQIRIDKSLYWRIKAHCVAREIKIGVFFEEILTWFLFRLNQSHIIYYASQQEGYLMTIRINEIHIESIDNIAKKEKISHARVIFTALISYIKIHKL